MTVPQRATNHRGQRTKQAILDAAMDLFAGSGYRGTGLIAIGDRAGVSHAAVLYHFGTAENLLLSVLDERLLLFNEASNGALIGDPVQVLRSIPEIARFNTANPELTKLFIVLKAESLNEESPSHAYFVAHRRRTHKLFRKAIEAGVTNGQFRSDVDAETKAGEIMAFIGGAENDYFLDPQRLDLEALYQAYTDDLLRNLTT
jgi:AcrR family transcriptional regulator